METVLPPAASSAGLYAAGVQVGGNVDEWLPTGHPAKDFSDDFIIRGVESIPQILPLLIAKR